MPVRIINMGAAYRVEWMEADCFIRDRTFYSYREAERYAMQIECRLLLEQMLMITPYEVDRHANE